MILRLAMGLLVGLRMREGSQPSSVRRGVASGNRAYSLDREGTLAYLPESRG